MAGGRTHRPLSSLAAPLFALLALAALLAFASPAPAAAGASGFPRLGSIWPDSSESNASLARYDYVILGGAEKARIPQVKAINPNTLLLTTDNACEVSLSSLRNYPASWPLTQVGSTLTAAVDAATKTLPVAAVTASGKTLFGVGDIVVLGDEIAYVEAVGTNSLTVRRGAYRPATAHAAGTRVAATITFWAGTVVMDMSTYCPRATVDAAVGPENWYEHHGRTSAARVTAAAWDGIYVDRTDGDQSWLVTSTFTRTAGRTIDPDRSNRLVTDGYDAFDAAWNAGLRLYEQKMRAIIGSGRVILGNGAWPNYDLLNGTIFEAFPKPDGGIMAIGWRDAVFTPNIRWGVTGMGSYTQWSSTALQPNLTTVETKQSDATVPDYRNMRFGLTTALMGDGCFTYLMNGDMRMWFDEYDGGGLGIGYLGRPLGAAKPALSPLSTPDLVSGDGAFDSSPQLDTWRLSTSTGYSATKTLDTAERVSGAASVRISVTQAAGTIWRANLRHRASIVGGQPYTLTFKARADRPLDFYSYLERATSTGGVTQTSFGTVRLTTQWQTFELPATPGGTDPAANLILGFGEEVGTLWLDDVKLQAGNQRDVMRRDFEHGVALINATDRAVSVDLGGTYRKIRGTQVPTLNDGSLVGVVTLPAMDGVVLLRQTDTPGQPDTTPPAVAITSPTNGSVVSGPVVLTALASDNVGVSRVEFRVDGALLGTDTSAPYEAAWDASTAAPGLHIVTAIAYDAVGNASSVSASVNVPGVSDTGKGALHRFYNKSNGTHFYTASPTEVAAVIANLSATYQYEGPAYQVFLNGSNGVPVHRFYNVKTGSHFYTASAAEKDRTIATLFSAFRYEGVAFYVATAPDSGFPVYRFYNLKTGSHFYTADSAEKGAVIAKYPTLFHYEGVAYYAPN